MIELRFKLSPRGGRGWYSGVEIRCQADGCTYVEIAEQLPIEKERLFAHANEVHFFPGAPANRAEPDGEVICPPMYFVKVSYAQGRLPKQQHFEHVAKELAPKEPAE